MKKVAIAFILIIGLSACGSARPKYLRCSKNKRCVIKSSINTQEIVVLQMNKSKNKINF